MSLVMLLRSTPFDLYQINIFRVKTNGLGYDRICCSVYFKELYIWKLFVCDLLSTSDELTPIVSLQNIKYSIFFPDIIDRSCYTRLVSYYLNACFSKQLTPWKQAVKNPRSVWFFVQLAQQVVNSEWHKKRCGILMGCAEPFIKTKALLREARSHSGISLLCFKKEQGVIEWT